MTEVAKACDICLKPWRHYAINTSDSLSVDQLDQDFDLSLRVECRCKDGQRSPENDLEVEIYRSGKDLSITLSWLTFPEKPILWHGKHSIWMDSVTGKRVDVPLGASSLEALARRLRASFLEDDEFYLSNN